MLFVGGLCLLAGLDAGLLLLGLPAPVASEQLVDLHAQLMVFGFLGTIISLERAIAVGRWWALAAPLGFGSGALAMLMGASPFIGEALQLCGALALTTTYRALYRRQPAPAITIQALGAVMASAAAILWLGGVATPTVVPWAAGFVVLTIAGERLDLARISMSSPSVQLWGVGFATAVTVAAVAMTLWPQVGSALFGAALIALVFWLLRYDIATRTIRLTGLPRYTAACLLAGYAWLVVAGLAWIAAGATTGSGAYDLSVHAVFIGFGLSMILGHAPIILPAVIGRPLPYRAVMWLAFGVLQLSLLLRVVVGDLRSVTWAWQAGGALNVVAVLTFLVVAIGSVVVAARSAAQASNSRGRHVVHRERHGEQEGEGSIPGISDYPQDSDGQAAAAVRGTR